MSEYPKADLLPPITETTAPFWEGLNEGKLRLQYCPACNGFQSPPETFCYECGSTRLEWRDTSGQGTVWSFITVHQKYHAAFYDEIPYNVSIVEIDDEPRPRLVTNLVGIDPHEVEIGMRVKVAPRPVAEGQNALFFERA